MDDTQKMKKVMTKDEIALLIDLIQSNPILTSKETNATTNKYKDDAWTSLVQAYNARSGSVPKSKEQLKLKWDNLKKAARKRAQQIRMNNLKTGGGKPELIIPKDEILEKVTGLLGSTCTGFDVPFGGDGIGGGSVMDIASNNSNNNATSSNVIIEYLALNDATNINTLAYNPTIPVSVAETPCGDKEEKKRNIDLCEGNSPSAESAKYFFGKPMSKQLKIKKKDNKRADSDVEKSIITRNLAIASYYDKKKEKLDLEIKLLNLELAQKENNVNTK